MRCEGVCLTILAFGIRQDMGRYREVVPVSAFVFVLKELVSKDILFIYSINSRNVISWYIYVCVR